MNQECKLTIFLKEGSIPRLLSNWLDIGEPLREKYIRNWDVCCHDPYKSDWEVKSSLTAPLDCNCMLPFFYFMWVLSLLKSSQKAIRACSFSHLYFLLFLVSLVWDCVCRPEFSDCGVLFLLHSDCGVLLLCCACLLDCLFFSFSLFSVLTVCSGPALGNTRSYKLLDWNSVTAGISPLLLLSPIGVMAAQWNWWIIFVKHALNTHQFWPSSSTTN